MSDLLGRLRAVDVSWSQVGEDCAAAADEIERLRERVSELEKAELPTGGSLRAVADMLERADARTAKLTEQVNRLINHCDIPECGVCGEIDCPHGDSLHFHHDGCPSCVLADSDTKKEEEMNKGIIEYPAFPVRVSNDDGTSTLYVGMSLLDFFAGQALPSVIQMFGDAATTESFAEESYRIAKAMLAERARSRGEG